MMKIEIEKVRTTIGEEVIEGSFSWRVACGDRYEDQLDTSEALWAVVNLLMDKGAVPYLRTKAQHDAWEEKYGPKKPLEPHQKLLPVQQ